MTFPRELRDHVEMHAARDQALAGMRENLSLLKATAKADDAQLAALFADRDTRPVAARTFRALAGFALAEVVRSEIEQEAKP